MLFVDYLYKSLQLHYSNFPWEFYLTLIKFGILLLKKYCQILLIFYEYFILISTAYCNYSDHQSTVISNNIFSLIICWNFLILKGKMKIMRKKLISKNLYLKIFLVFLKGHKCLLFGVKKQTCYLNIYMSISNIHPSI